MCGIVGIQGNSDISQALIDGLIQLQHRGQDAAGIISSNETFHIHRGKGLVREVFNGIEPKKALPGNTGIGHVRYPTHGGDSQQEIQPFWTGHPYGIAIAHNGNLTNYPQIKAIIENTFQQHLNTASDSELLMHLLARGIQSAREHSHDLFDNLVSAVSFLQNYLEGSYSVVGAIANKGLFAFRDPHGIRPLVIGKKEQAGKPNEYIIASENTMFFQLGFHPIGDIAPGEVVFINQRGELKRQQLKSKTFKPCVFEYIYFARPDAKLNDVSVYRARLRMGQNLAAQWKKSYPDLPLDVVIPVPFTSNTAALAFASQLSVRYSEGLYKNPFIGRTFIMATNKKRKKSVRHKLSPQETEIRGKHVLLLDDSIVRGNTCLEMVSMLKEIGAKSVYFASACPMVKHPCFYGIDMPTKEELIAHSRNELQIQKKIGADALLYQTIEDLQEAITRRGEHKIETPCLACLNGQYLFENNQTERTQSIAYS